MFRPWLDQLVEGGLVEVPLRLSKSLRYQVVATFERHSEKLSSTAAMAGSFMPLRGVAADATEREPPFLSAVANGSGRRVLASLGGLYLERLSAQGRRRALATLLGPPRAITPLPAKAAGGLIAYLALRERGPLCSCVIDGRWGAAAVADNSSSIAAVTREVGGAGRIEHFGSDGARALLDRYRDEWLNLGSPTTNDLLLAVSFGPTTPSRPWRRVALDASVVAVSWKGTPQRSGRDGRRATT